MLKSTNMTEVDNLLDQSIDILAKMQIDGTSSKNLTKLLNGYRACSNKKNKLENDIEEAKKKLQEYENNFHDLTTKYNNKNN